MVQSPTIQTTIFISLFLIGYLFGLLRNATKHTIDLYDLILLVSVAIVPSVFVFFPEFTDKLSKFLGVLFPFVVLFGLLFFIVFVYLYRLVVKTNHHKFSINTITQELSILRHKLDQHADDVDKKHKPQDNPADL